MPATSRGRSGVSASGWGKAGRTSRGRSATADMVSTGLASASGCSTSGGIAIGSGRPLPGERIPSRVRLKGYLSFRGSRTWRPASGRHRLDQSRIRSRSGDSARRCWRGCGLVWSRHAKAVDVTVLLRIINDCRIGRSRSGVPRSGRGRCRGWNPPSAGSVPRVSPEALAFRGRE